MRYILLSTFAVLGAVAILPPALGLAPSAPSAPSAPTDCEPLVICADGWADDTYFARIVKKDGKLTLTLVAAVGLDGQPIAGADPDDPDGPTPPDDGSSRIGQVRTAMAAIGQLPKFEQQLKGFDFMLVVTDSDDTRAKVFNATNRTLELVLEGFAEQWDPWRLPFVEAMDGATERDDLIAVIAEARAFLSEGD